MGKTHWYRLSAAVPEQIVQLELFDARGAFTGGVVRTGTFAISGPELDPATCGLCLRAIADKSGELETEYFATGGSVEIAAVAPDENAPFVATITNATFGQVAADKTFVPDGCTGDIARVKVSGTMEIVGGTGGGGGGGGGTGACAKTVGD